MKKCFTVEHKGFCSSTKFIICSTYRFANKVINWGSSKSDFLNIDKSTDAGMWRIKQLKN
jgi:hypothetical protein